MVSAAPVRSHPRTAQRAAVWILVGHRCTSSGLNLNLKLPEETLTGG